MSGSLDKALTLLRHLAASERGLRLTELAAVAGQPAPSVHRLLKTLEGQGFVARGPAREWRLGPSLASMTEASRRHFALQELAEPALARLTGETEMTSYLSVVSGRDSLCLMRVDGTGEVRTLTMDAGMRRPLGIGAGSMALLAEMEEGAARETVAAIAAERSGNTGSYDPAGIMAQRRVAQRQGYAEHQGILIPGICGLGMAGDAGGRAFAVSVSFIGSLYGEERRSATRARLARTVLEIEAAVSKTVGSVPKGI